MCVLWVRVAIGRKTHVLSEYIEVRNHIEPLNHIEVPVHKCKEAIDKEKNHSKQTYTEFSCFSPRALSLRFHIFSQDPQTDVKFEL